VSKLEVVQSFIDTARNVRDSTELATMISAIARELGFEHFAIVEHVDLSEMSLDYGHMERGEFIGLTDVPDDWFSAYVDEGLIAVDPVIAASKRTEDGFAWRDIPAMIDWNPDHEAFRLRAAEFGICDGYSVPGIIGGEVRGTCSFAIGPDRDFPQVAPAMVELVGRYAFEAARELVLRARMGQAASVRLSPRQVECIELIALGKTDWEIAKILGLSEATVKEYVDDARRRYGVSKRVQLVLKAVFDGHLLLRDLATLS